MILLNYTNENNLHPLHPHNKAYHPVLKNWKYNLLVGSAALFLYEKI
jgi:hypothetical protein